MDREPAFSAYVAARRAMLFRTACLLCGDPHRAEDVVQDALARLYVNWARVVRADNVDGYVRRILVNSHYSDRRRPWRREVTSKSVELPLEPGDAPEDADALWAAIRRLPPGQRKVVVLRHIWDRSVEETAADLGISPAHGAVMLSVLLGVGFMSRQVWGAISDRIGGLVTLLISSVLQAAGMAGFLLTQDEAGLFAVAGAFGVGFSALIPAYVLAIREYFPAREASWRVPALLLLSGSGLSFGASQGAFRVRQLLFELLDLPPLLPCLRGARLALRRGGPTLRFRNRRAGQRVERPWLDLL